MTSPALVERITRSLAYMLRHQPEKFDLELDAHGFGNMEDVVRALNERLGEPVDEEDVQYAVESGDRPRYEIVNSRVRALYGHSIDVEPGEPSKPPELLYVGISNRDADRALRYGLRGGRRRFLHLALTSEDAKESGRRTGREYVVMTVYALDAWEEGINFFDRQALFLAEEIPTEFLESSETCDDGYERAPTGDGRNGRSRRGGGRRRPEGDSRRRDRDDAPRGRPDGDSERERDGERSRERAPQRGRGGDRGGDRGRDRGRDRSSDRPRGRDRDRDSDRQGAGERREREPARSQDRGERRERDGGRGRGDRDRGGRGERAGRSARSDEAPSKTLTPEQPAARTADKPAASSGGGGGFGKGIFEAPKEDKPKRRPAKPKPKAEPKPKPKAEREQEPAEAQPEQKPASGPGFGAGLV